MPVSVKELHVRHNVLILEQDFGALRLDIYGSNLHQIRAKSNDGL